jgi:hypothetical protein
MKDIIPSRTSWIVPSPPTAISFLQPLEQAQKVRLVVLPDLPVKHTSKGISSALKRSSARHHKEAALEEAAKLFTIAYQLSGFVVIFIIIRELTEGYPFDLEKLSTNVANKGNE